jgi:glyoxylase-like metal-dependent hydrolase (beta-lactamase superfamily II)
MARVIPLSEGSFTVDATKKFIPFNPEIDRLQQRNKGSLLVEIQPFLVITSQDIILLDTGLGFRNADGVLQIHQNLIDHGVNPMEVTKVLLSHLHKDHAGGIAATDPITGARALTFPHATYYVNESELRYAFEQDGKSYHKEDFELLTQYDNVVITPDSGSIDDYIQYEVNGGHCPYHQSFWIREETDVLFFGGDVAPQLSQMKSRFVAKYDYDGKRCMELRQQYLEAGKAEGWNFMFYHDVSTPTTIFS